MQHEVRAKAFHIEAIRRQMDDLATSLEALEIDRLQERIKHLEDVHERLCDSTKRLTEKLSKALEQRRGFEAALESVRTWLSEKIVSAVDSDTVPLKSSEVEKNINVYKVMSDITMSTFTLPYVVHGSLVIVSPRICYYFTFHSPQGK